MQRSVLVVFAVLAVFGIAPPTANAAHPKPVPTAAGIESHLPRLTRALRKRWPGIVFASVSHNHKTVVFYDSSALRLTDAQGRHPRELAVQLSWDFANAMITDMSFSFKPDNTRVAVLVTMIGGEPMGATWERLYTADVASGRVRLLTEWGYRIMGHGPKTGDREVRGWSADGKSVVVSGNVYGGQEMPIDQEMVGTETVLVNDIQGAKPRPKK